VAAHDPLWSFNVPLTGLVTPPDIHEAILIAALRSPHGPLLTTAVVRRTQVAVFDDLDAAFSKARLLVCNFW
jgi:hypothetical protein